MWIYGIKTPFFLVNHFSQTRFLKPDFSNHFSTLFQKNGFRLNGRVAQEPRQKIIYNYCVQVILVKVSCVRVFHHTSWYKLQCFAEFIFICLFCNRDYFLFATHLIFLYSPRQVVRTSMWTLSGYASRGLISKLGCPKYFLYAINFDSIQEGNPYSHSSTAHSCKTLFSFKYCSSENMNQSVFGQVLLIQNG